MLTVFRFVLVALAAGGGLLSFLAAVQSGARSPLVVALLFVAGAWWAWPKAPVDEDVEAAEGEDGVEAGERVVPLEKRLEIVEGHALRATLDHLESMVLGEMEAAGMAQGEAARTALRRLGGHPEGDAQREADYRRTLRRTVLALALNRLQADLTSADPWPEPVDPVLEMPTEAAQPATA